PVFLLSQDADYYVAPLPQGEFVPNELIARYPVRAGMKEAIIEAEYASEGIMVKAARLNAAETDFLITFLDEVPMPEPNPCGRPEQGTISSCEMCEIIQGNPGDGPSSSADWLWPNYIVSTGLIDDFMAGVAHPSEEQYPPGCAIPQQEATYSLFSRCNSLRPIPALNIGEEVVDIAILDSGIEDWPFAEFFSYENAEGKPVSIVNWHPVTEAEESGAISYEGIDENGHGTAVAQATLSQFHQADALDKVVLHSYRVLGADAKGTMAQLMSALDKAINDQVDVINMSLGFIGLNCDGHQEEAIASYLTQAREQDILIFTSAGNDGNNLSTNPQWPAAISDNPNVYTVGASRCADESTWSHSNVGTSKVDLTAPGQNLLLPYVPLECFINVDGTSFACPIVAGYAAASLTQRSVEQTICLLESRPTKYRSNIPGIQESRLGSITYSDPVAITCGSLDDHDGSVDLGGDLDGTGLNGGSPLSPRVVSSPNPFDQSLEIRLMATFGQETHLRLFDNNGKLVVHRKTNQGVTRINTSELPRGLYYLNVTSATGSSVQKLIKQ
ncbi:MAG: S8 family serine peptidase, partial [Bacteroidota bacterium]